MKSVPGSFALSTPLSTYSLGYPTSPAPSPLHVIFIWPSLVLLFCEPFLLFSCVVLCLLLTFSFGAFCSIWYHRKKKKDTKRLYVELWSNNRGSGEWKRFCKKWHPLKDVMNKQFSFGDLNAGARVLRVWKCPANIHIFLYEPKELIERKKHLFWLKVINKAWYYLCQIPLKTEEVPLHYG